MTASTGFAEPPPQAPAAIPRRPKASLWTLRITALLHTIVLILQPLLGGMYLDGSVDAISFHGINAHIVQLVCFVQIIAALLYAWPGGGRVWPLVASSVLWLVEGFQVGMGYGRILFVHVLLGVLLVVAQVLFTAWSFRKSAGEARIRRFAR